MNITLQQESCSVCLLILQEDFSDLSEAKQKDRLYKFSKKYLFIVYKIDYYFTIEEVIITNY